MLEVKDRILPEDITYFVIFNDVSVMVTAKIIPLFWRKERKGKYKDYWTFFMTSFSH